MWLLKRQKDEKSVQALQESKLELQKTELRTAKVVEVSNALRTLRERNHFAEQLADIMGGPR